MMSWTKNIMKFSLITNFPTMGREKMKFPRLVAAFAGLVQWLSSIECPATIFHCAVATIF
jgi:hypothetical protein